MVMLSIEIAFGLLLGALGAAWHLWVVSRRAIWATQGHAGRALLSYPFGLFGPALAVVVAAQIAAHSAWFTLAGVMLVHSLALARHRSSS